MSAELFAQHYAEIRRIAKSRLRQMGDLTLLDTTDLINEAYMKLSASEADKFENREHFLAYASTAMRSIVVDFARAKGAGHRRGEGADVTLCTLLGERLAAPQLNSDSLLDIDEALNTIAATEPRLVQVVEMRFFGGFTEDEIATALNVSLRTVKRDWEKARMLLLALLGDDAA